MYDIGSIQQIKVSVKGLITRFYPKRKIKVDIDIKPGSSPNPINLKGKEKIPVAILSSPNKFYD
jgi:hypothetical protein